MRVTLTSGHGRIHAESTDLPVGVSFGDVRAQIGGYVISGSPHAMSEFARRILAYCGEHATFTQDDGVRRCCVCEGPVSE